jgi:hypothetical protein
MQKMTCFQANYSQRNPKRQSDYSSSAGRGWQIQRNQRRGCITYITSIATLALQRAEIIGTLIAALSVWSFGILIEELIDGLSEPISNTVDGIMIKKISR